ncbi:MAG: zinc-binding dehydrogenase [Thermoanaerobaculia bacterium]
MLAFTGQQLPECLDALRRGGRLAYPEGIEPSPRKRRGVKTVSYDAEAGPRQFERLERAITEARLKVPIPAAYPLAAAWKAHRRVESGHLVGKIVLRIR